MGPFVEESTTLRNFSRIYDFVTTGQWPGTEADLLEVRHELTPIGEVIQVNFIGPAGDDLIPEEARAKIQLIFEHLLARLALHEMSELDLRQVALLSGLAEKTVRMAATRTGDGPELNTFKKDNRTWVTCEEALHWLSTKRGFRPTRFVDQDFMPTVVPTDLRQLRWGLRSQRERVRLSIDDLASRLAWDDRTRGEYERLEADGQEFDPRVFHVPGLLALALALRVGDPAAFAKAAARILAELVIEQEIAAALAEGEKEGASCT